MAISTNGAIITRVTSALYGEYLSNASYDEVSTTAPATLAANFLSNDFAGKTDLQIATTMLKNLGLTSITGLDNWLSAQLTASGSTTAAKGAKIVSILNDYANMTSDATYGSYATSFNAKVSAGLVKSQTAGNAGGAYATADAVAITNGTFTLTTGLDTGSSFTGGSGDDTFSSTDTGTATSTTLTAGDSLVGGAGTDTLLIATSGTVTAAPVISAVGIENLSVVNNSTGAGYAIDATLASGLSKVVVNAGQSPTSVTGVSAIISAEMIGSNKNLTITGATAVIGLADATTLTLNAVATTADTSFTYDGIETLNVVSNGSASGSKTNASELTVVSNELETVNVSGSAAIHIRANLTGSDAATQTSTFDASAATGGVTAYITKGDSTAVLIKGGSGADSISLVDSAGAALAVTKTMTITGGEGTDTLVVAAATYDTTTAAVQPGANVSGFEVASGSVDQRVYPSNTFTSSTGAGSYTKMSATYTAAEIAATGSLTVTRSVAATTDALTVNLVGTANTTATVTADEDETLTFNSAGTAGITNTVSLTSATVSKIVATGSNALDLGTLGSTSTAVSSVDASAHTGSSFSVNAGSSTTAMTIKGSAGVPTALTGTLNTLTGGTKADSITGGSYKDVIAGGLGADTIDGGAGNDTLNGDAGNDSILGGSGLDIIDGGIGSDYIDGGDDNDTITTGTGSDTVLGGAGNDKIYNSSLDSNDNIDGGAGTTDTLSGRVLSTDIVAADYADSAGDVTLVMTGVETAYIQYAPTSTSTTAATQETLDLTGVTGLTTLNLDIDDTGSDAFILVKNFGGTTINLSETADAKKMTIDGTGQDLTVSLKAFDNSGTAGVASTVFTGVGALTVSGKSYTTDSTGAIAQHTNKIGAGITASTATGYTLSTTGSTSAVTLNANALNVADASVTAAQAVTLSAGTYDTLTSGVITAGTEVQTLSMTVGQSGRLSVGANSGPGTTDINLSTSSLTTTTIDVGVGGRLWDTSAGVYATIAATSVGKVTATLGAASVTDLNISGDISTGSTAAMSAGSTWSATALGGTGASSLTLSGTGDFDTAVTLSGTSFTFNASALDDSTGVQVTVTTKGSVTGTAYADSITGGTGNDTISGGAGADTLTGGAGADAITTGTGTAIDRLVVTGTSSVAASASDVTLGASTTLIDNLDTFTFANGVDTVTDFSSVDVFDVTTAGTTYSNLNGATAATALTANTHYYLLGTYTGGVFTVNSAATATTANVATLVVTDATAGTLAAQAGIVILVGTIASDLGTANFI